MYDKFVILLQKNKVTPYQVAKATGVSQTTFSDWKRGRSAPKIEKLQKIANYFDVPITYFTEDTDASVNREAEGESVIDDTMVEILDWMRYNPETKDFLAAAKKIKPEDMKRATKIIEALAEEGKI